MAAEIEASAEQVSKLATATKEHDGIAAMKLLEEVGSCGWNDLVKKTNDSLRLDSNWAHSPRLGTESSVKFSGAGLQTITLHRNTSRISSPLASTTDLRCEEK